MKIMCKVGKVELDKVTIEVRGAKGEVFNFDLGSYNVENVEMELAMPAEDLVAYGQMFKDMFSRSATTTTTRRDTTVTEPELGSKEWHEQFEADRAEHKRRYDEAVSEQQKFEKGDVEK